MHGFAFFLQLWVDKLNVILTFLTSFILIFIFAKVIYMHTKFSGNLNKEAIKDEMETFFENISTSKKENAFFSSIFILRRIMTVLTLTILREMQII